MKPGCQEISEVAAVALSGEEKWLFHSELESPLGL